MGFATPRYSPSSICLSKRYGPFRVAVMEALTSNVRPLLSLGVCCSVMGNLSRTSAPRPYLRFRWAQRTKRCVTGTISMKALRKSYGCPVEFSLDIIGGKWKAVILARLKRRSMRYSELRKAIPDLSEKVLTQRFHGLCEDGLVEMTPSAGGVSHYRLTETGA